MIVIKVGNGRAIASQSFADHLGLEEFFSFFGPFSISCYLSLGFSSKVSSVSVSR